MPQPFADVLLWLYVDQSSQSPKLLKKAMDALKEVIVDDGKGNTRRGGLTNPVSKGAMVMFKRYLTVLENINTN